MSKPQTILGSGIVAFRAMCPYCGSANLATTEVLGPQLVACDSDAVGCGMHFVVTARPAAIVDTFTNLAELNGAPLQGDPQ